MELASGYTLMHEHTCIDLTPGDPGTRAFDEFCADLRELNQRWGVGNLVDLTNQSMGRNVDYVQRLAEETNINIIMSTGYYLEQYIADYVEEPTIEELTEIAVRDLTEGIDGTDVKAHVIGEIAWSKPEPGPLELKAWDAMCAAALRTGAVVSTHATCGYQDLQQAVDLVSRGIDPNKVVIGHCEFCPDDESLKKLLGTGVCIGIDMIGNSDGMGDEYRADLVSKVKDMGCLSQVTLSLDLCNFEDLRSTGGYGYSHLFEVFLPLLKDRGITDDDIELMLDKTPRRIFMD